MLCLDQALNESKLYWDLSVVKASQILQCKSKPDNSNISYKDCGHNKMLFPKFRLRQGTSDYT